MRWMGKCNTLSCGGLVTLDAVHETELDAVGIVVFESTVTVEVVTVAQVGKKDTEVVLG